MNNLASQASEKLRKDKPNVRGMKEQAMADPVIAALESFCLQSDVFSQAVINGGPFSSCMKTVAKGTGNSISDLDAYRKDVQFYFPEAKVQMELTIQTADDEKRQDGKSAPVILDLSDLRIALARKRLGV